MTKRFEDMGTRRRSSRLALALAFAVVLLIGFAWLFVVMSTNPLRAAQAAALKQIEAPVSSQERRLRVVVREGDTAATIGQRLAEKGLVRNAEVFRLVARWRGVDQRFLPGEYELSPSMTLPEIMEALQAGDPVTGRITWIEGWRAAQMADALAARGIVARDDFLAATLSRDYPVAFLSEIPAGQSLEGYLFPDTYQLGRRMAAVEVVRMALETFERRVWPLWLERRGSVDLSLHQVVTLASIVEREAQRPEERALIAGVFRNRLRAGMPLQADPTVQFALVGPVPATRPTDGYWKAPLSAADLEVPSPYNTYRQPGLPPGPIASPGLAAIQAVLQPAPTDDLYFVAADDGRHLFAKTLEEHQRNVAAQR